MGANYFRTESAGATVEAAFELARTDAFYEFGHGGYTGSIAEKAGFEEFSFATFDEAREVVRLIHDYEQPENERREKVGEALWDAIDEITQDKWSDCVAIKIDNTRWIFFGWASC
jgi:hypothetical protein